MQFGLPQKLKFDAENGSYSLVTSRELYDSQITATDAETMLLRSYFTTRGERIHVGNVKSDKEAASKEFRLFPSGDIIHLNLVYPKPEKGELRLYLSKAAGFFPNEGDVWFLYQSNKDQSMWIGSMPEKEWRKINAYGKIDEYVPPDAISDIDEIDAKIIADQRSEGQPVEPEIPSQQRQTSGKTIIRSREIALERMHRSRYKCEYNREHKLFIAKATGCPYLEAHHIIPICFQKQLHGLNLDDINNLCCLCPNCHRAIHHAEDEYVREILSIVAKEREIEHNFGFTLNDLYKLYAVEEIVRDEL